MQNYFKFDFRPWLAINQDNIIDIVLTLATRRDITYMD